MQFLARRLALAFAALLLVGGCGNAGQDEGTGGAPTGVLPKAMFIKRADKICEAADRRQLQLRGVYLKRRPNAEEGEAGQIGIVTKVALPPLRQEVAELQKIPLPKAEPEAVEELLEELDGKVKEAVADPKKVVEGGWTLTAVEKKAKSYGFVSCAAPS